MINYSSYVIFMRIFEILLILRIDIFFKIFRYFFLFAVTFEGKTLCLMANITKIFDSNSAINGSNSPSIVWFWDREGANLFEKRGNPFFRNKWFGATCIKYINMVSTKVNNLISKNDEVLKTNYFKKMKSKEKEENK